MSHGLLLYVLFSIGFFIFGYLFYKEQKKQTDLKIKQLGMLIELGVMLITIETHLDSIKNKGEHEG